jgi:hypothetical protein
MLLEGLEQSKRDGEHETLTLPLLQCLPPVIRSRKQLPNPLMTV